MSETANELPYRIRAIVEADKPKIFSDWLKGYRYSPLGKTISTGVYFREHHALVERLLSRGRVLVVVDAAKPEDIWGWGCGERLGDLPIVHFVWVDRAIQGHGIGSIILAELTGSPSSTSRVDWVYTHATSDSDRHFPKRGGVYYPYILFKS